MYLPVEGVVVPNVFAAVVVVPPKPKLILSSNKLLAHNFRFILLRNKALGSISYVNFCKNITRCYQRQNTKYEVILTQTKIIPCQTNAMSNIQNCHVSVKRH